MTSSVLKCNDAGLPGSQLEEWKYTRLSNFLNRDFHAATSPSPSTPLTEIVAGGPYWQMVFVNGRWDASRSILDGLPPGVAVQTTPAKNGFTAETFFKKLNQAAASEVLTIEVPAGVTLKFPIYLLFVSNFTNGEAGTMANPRVSIKLGVGARARVIEQFRGDPDFAIPYLNNSVTQIELAKESSLVHAKIATESPAAIHLSSVDVSQNEASRFTSHVISLAGALVRTELYVKLNEKNCYCALNGLFFGEGENQVDNYTWIDHLAPHCQSEQFYKGVVTGKSTGVFSGKVIVRPDAQKTNARQSSRNLLLSEDATINAKPQLEIYADDVKCAHGATTGQLDSESIFYLRARGIDEVEARKMLTEAFVLEMLDRIDDPDLAKQLGAFIGEKLSSREKPNV
jgi:Fe-S cluster assembly protein SufD